MPRDLIEERALIDLSRVQREALERWWLICMDAGETVVAEEVRQAFTATEMREAA